MHADCLSVFDPPFFLSAPERLTLSAQQCFDNLNTAVLLGITMEAIAHAVDLLFVSVICQQGLDAIADDFSTIAIAIANDAQPVVSHSCSSSILIGMLQGIDQHRHAKVDIFVNTVDACSGNRTVCMLQNMQLRCPAKGINIRGEFPQLPGHQLPPQSQHQIPGRLSNNSLDGLPVNSNRFIVIGTLPQSKTVS